ncbi:MAG: methylenetetrahydrofolate--tRNA-(uracil(54)-C(5))-methyltransferase (FADH(2)-oxidizing) TrmFO [Bradymonadia bacterium]
MTNESIKIVGGGLAGCELALQLAHTGAKVTLFEMKPHRRTAAQESDLLSELVCSNSFRSANVGNAIGQLKREMRTAGSFVMKAADAAAVPAGDALAVDRTIFASTMTEWVHAHPNITVETGVVTQIPSELTVICTGPLTAPELATEIAQRAGRDQLHFYDAIAPIIDSDSIDWDVVWRQSRYDKGGADYGNVPLTQDEYYQFIQDLNQGDQVKAKDFEENKFFEGCLPIEVMAARGPETLAHGPLKPVGLTDPNSDESPYAVVQLRMENNEGTAWNLVGFQTRLKYPEQKRIFQKLRGLEKAEFLRYGSVHRNTYLHAPSLLSDKLHWHDAPNLYFAGQITGVEGYVESTACAMLVSWFIRARWQGCSSPSLPPTTAFGALYRHLRGDGILSKYVPSNLNWSLFTPIEKKRREPRRERRLRMGQRAQTDFLAWLESHGHLAWSTSPD